MNMNKRVSEKFSFLTMLKTIDISQKLRNQIKNGVQICNQREILI
jgi:hypothetical protein